MGGPVSSVLWSLWLRNRWALVLLTVSSVAGCAALYVARALGLKEDPVETLSWALLFLPVIIGAASILLIHSDADRLEMVLPRRLLRMPIHSWKLAAAFLAYSAAAIGVVSLGATVAVRLAFKPELTWWAAPAAAVMLTLALAAWAMGQKEGDPKTALVTFLLIFAPAAWLIRSGALDSISPIAGVLGFVALLCAIYALAVAALTINRRGGLPELLAFSFGVKASPRTLRLADIPAFKSAWRAQLWYEWRQFGWQLPVALTAVLVGYFVGMPSLTSLFAVEDIKTGTSTRGVLAVDWLSSPQFVVTGMQIGALLAGMFAGGYMFMRAGYWNTKSTYLMTRPTRTSMLANARAAMFASSTLAGVLVLSALLAAVIAITQARGDITGIVNFLAHGFERKGIPDAAIVLFFIGSLGVLMWTALWSVNLGYGLAVFAGIYLPGAGVAWLLVHGGTIDEDSGKSITQYAGWAASGALVVSVLCVVAASARARVLGLRAVAVALLLWIVLAAAFVAYGTLWQTIEEMTGVSPQFAATLNHMEGGTWPHPIDWYLWAGLLLLPLAPLFSHPYLLDRTRHQ